jgi:phosphopantothenoylcysteine decarboxylase
MIEPNANTRRVVYLIICAAPPAQEIHQLIVQTRAAQWEVCAIATPQATRFIDAPLLAQLTGYPVRSDYKSPGEPDVFPQADALVVMPATFNTINKWALGIADTLAVSILCEALGRNTPIVAVPYLKLDLARHPVFTKSLTTLRECGIRILYEPERYPPSNRVPWEVIIDELQKTQINQDDQQSVG